MNACPQAKERLFLERKKKEEKNRKIKVFENDDKKLASKKVGELDKNSAVFWLEKKDEKNRKIKVHLKSIKKSLKS